MSPSPTVSTRVIASAVVGAVAAVLGLYLFGLLVGVMPTPPHWIAAHSELYVPVLRLVVWLPVVALCALVITRIARTNPFPFGVIAGLFGLVALLLQIREFGYSLLLGASYWLEIALLVVLLPIVCALWRPRGA